MGYSVNVTINGKDARTTWGIVFDSAAISALMTPPAAKDRISNTSRQEHGTRTIITDERVAERDVTLTFALLAKMPEMFFGRYASLCEELKAGKLDITVSIMPDVVYRCLYISCQQFTQYNNKLARFSLKLNEPNPADRSKEEQDG